MSTVDFSLFGKTALVTGGSRGLGAAIVECFAAQGANVAFCHLDDTERADVLATTLRKQSFRVEGIEADVSLEADVDRLREWVLQRLTRVDILVNCAGIGSAASFADLSVAAWDRMIAVNLRGAFLVTRAFLPEMMERRAGRVINIASQLAYSGAPMLAHYCAAKAGLLGFTRAVAQEAAPHGVLVNAVAPGAFESDMLMALPQTWRDAKATQLPIGRLGRVEDIVPSVLLLATAGGAFYVGQTLSPNGGDVML